jgi:hypothetical protein
MSAYALLHLAIPISPNMPLLNNQTAAGIGTGEIFSPV